MLSDTSAQSVPIAGLPQSGDEPDRRGPGMWRRRGALGERDFRNLYLARAFSLLGDGLVPVALAFAVLVTENSASALGLVLASRAISLVGFACSPG